MRDKLIALIDATKACPYDFPCEECTYNDEPSCFSPRLADELIANGVTIQEWIPVSERLPEDSGLTLVRVDFSMWDKKVNVPSLERYVNEEKTWFCDGAKLTNVTHWMPLPEVPKEVE